MPEPTPDYPADSKLLAAFEPLEEIEDTADFPIETGEGACRDGVDDRSRMRGNGIDQEGRCGHGLACRGGEGDR